MLRAFGHRVATCWVLLAEIWPASNLSQQHPTCCHTSQHGGQTHTTCCAQQCCDMLRWHVAIVWPGLKKKKYSWSLPVTETGISSGLRNHLTCMKTLPTRLQHEVLRDSLYSMHYLPVHNPIHCTLAVGVMNVSKPKMRSLTFKYCIFFSLALPTVRL